MKRVLYLLIFVFGIVTGMPQGAIASAYDTTRHPVDLFQFDSVKQQKEAVALAKTLRCPMCQNQNLIESNSAVAKDIRLRVFELVKQGQSEQQVKEFMVARYGEHVLYQPKLSWANALLWGGPLCLLILVLGFAILHIERSRTKDHAN